jgi:hypothetical protein
MPSTPSKLDEDGVFRFLAEYAQTGSIKRGAAAIGCSVGAIYMRRAQDINFKNAMQEALECYRDILQTEAHRRAVEGVPRLQFDKEGTMLRYPADYPDPELAGKPYIEHEYSDNLLVRLLKKYDPAFRDKLEVEKTIRKAVLIIPGAADPATLQAALREHNAQMVQESGQLLEQYARNE